MRLRLTSMRLAIVLPFRDLLCLMFCLREVFLVRSATCFPLPSVVNLLLVPLQVLLLLLAVLLLLVVLLVVLPVLAVLELELELVALDQLKLFQFEPLNI